MDLPAKKLYLIDNQTKYLVNNELLSDVTFLVGNKKQKIYAHKLILSLGLNYK